MFTRLRKQFPAIVADALAFLISFLGSYGVWNLLVVSENHARVPFSLFGTFVLTGLAIQFAIFIWEGIYSIEGSYLESAVANKILRALLITPFILFIASFGGYLHQIDKLLIVTGMMANLVVNPVLRSLFGIQELPDLTKRNTQKKKLIIVGNGVAGECLLRRVIETKSRTHELVGFLDKSAERVGSRIQTNSKEIRGDAEVIGTYEDAEVLLGKERPDELWINDLSLPPDRIEGLLNLCQRENIDVSIVPSLGQYPAQSLEVEMLDFVPMLRPRKVMNLPTFEFVKRALDIVLAGALGIMLLPIVIPVAIMIKRGSEGPVLFRQYRVGKNGKTFQLFKFRSMYTTANPYGVSPKSGADARITKIGRFLRKTSLDELPQILNVLRGEMSLVGPRPEMPFIVDQYTVFQRIRLAVKPGVTGLWQLSLDRTKPIHENMDYDLYYIHNRSLLLDLTILWRTLFLAMRGI